MWVFIYYAFNICVLYLVSIIPKAFSLHMAADEYLKHIVAGTTTEDDEEGKGYIEDESSGANSSSTDRNSFSEREIKPMLSKEKSESNSVLDTKVKIGNDTGLMCGKGSSIPVVTCGGTSSVSSVKSLAANSLLEAHRKAFKAAGGKAGCGGGSSSLRIRICKSPNNINSGVSGGTINNTNNGRQLETDSSNEYESETGIPKSPTLFISGVSISRTPEPRSPAIVTTSSGMTNCFVGRQSRSSSLTVPLPPPIAPPLSNTVLGSSSMSLNTTTATINSASPEPQPALMLKSSSPVNFTAVCTTLTSNNVVITPPPLPPLLPSPGSPVNIASPRSGAPSPILTSGNGSCIGVSSSTIQTSSNATTMNATKSKSASEPEREREMFRFPKSSTDGALSSVLHVQESNLSSDDFHEALFLLERSPKGGSGSSKRRKKSKKERHKDKENSNGTGSCSSKVKEIKEASSAL